MDLVMSLAEALQRATGVEIEAAERRVWLSMHDGGAIAPLTPAQARMIATLLILAADEIDPIKPPLSQ
jgi:hypothetical protein